MPRPAGLVVLRGNRDQVEDLRLEILLLKAQGLSQQEIAVRCNVSLRYINTTLARYKKTKSVLERQSPGRPLKIGAEGFERLKRARLDNPKASYTQLLEDNPGLCQDGTDPALSTLIIAVQKVDKELSIGSAVKQEQGEAAASTSALAQPPADESQSEDEGSPVSGAQSPISEAEVEVEAQKEVKEEHEHVAL